MKSLVVDFRHEFSQVTSSDAVWVCGGEVRRCGEEVYDGDVCSGEVRRCGEKVW